MNDVVSSGISEVSRPKRWLVGTLAIGLIVGHAYDVIARGEHWPLSGYPMYADMITTPTFRLVRLFAVTGEAPLREVAIEQGWMRNNLNRILRRADAKAQMRRAITAYGRASAWSRDGQAVLAYRVYEHHWDLDPNADSDRAPDSATLLFELRRPTPTGTPTTTPSTTTTTTQAMP